MPTAQEVFMQARAYLTSDKRAPYMAEMAYRITGSPIESTIGTFACTRDGRLVVDWSAVDIWGKQDNGKGYRRVAGALMHELLHLQLDHPARIEKLIAGVEDLRPLANIAADIYVNFLLGQAKNQDGSPMWPLPDFSYVGQGAKAAEAKDYNIPPGLTLEENFALLRKQQNKPKPKHVCAGACGSAAGNPAKDEPALAGKSGQNDGQGGAQPIPAAEMEMLREETARAMIEHGEKNRGSVASGLMRALKEMLAPPKVPWEDLLAGAIGHAAEHRPGSDQPTFSEPNIRQAGLGYGHGCPILPASVSVRPRVFVAVDTSGSMGQAELSRSLIETRAILEWLNAETTFIACDAAVHGITEVSDPSELYGLLKGGGGTNMRPIFDAIRDRDPQPDCVVVMTDGYIGSPGPEPDYRVVWCVLGGYTQDVSCWGDVVVVEE